MNKKFKIFGCLLATFLGMATLFESKQSYGAHASYDLNEVDKLFYGYNVTRGVDLLEQDALQMTFPIIDPNSDYTSHIARVNGSSNQQSFSASSSSLKKISEDYAASIGANVYGKIYMVDLDIEASFDLSKSIENTYSQYYEIFSTIISRYYYIVQLDTEQIKDYLSPQFKKELNAVNTEKDAISLFSRYGTHLNTGYTFGGRMNISNFKTTSSTSASLSSGVSLKEKVSTTIGKISAGESATISEQYSTYENTTEATSTYSFVSYGGEATSSLTLDGLFTYNQSLVDGNNAGFMYTRWINSINNNVDLSIIGIPNGAQSIPLWNLLDSTAATASKREALLNAYMNLCGDKYDEYCKKYKELVKSLSYAENDDAITSTIQDAYVKTPNGYFYNVNPDDLRFDGNHYEIHKDDVLYLCLNRRISLENISYTTENVNVISKKNSIFKITGDVGDAKVIVEYTNGDEKIKETLFSLPIKYRNCEGGTGANDYPFIIRTVSDFSKIRTLTSKCFILVNDLDFSGQPSFTPISSAFKGVLDGNYCKISNLTIASTNNQSNWGMFRSNTGTIKNLSFDSLTCGNSGDKFDKVTENKMTDEFEYPSDYENGITIAQYAGLICGTNTGTIDNVRISNGILNNICKEIIDRFITNNKRVLASGAICGLNSGNISNCEINNSKICTISSNSDGNNGTMKDMQISSGGICGILRGGTIKSCVANTGATGYVKSQANFYKNNSTIYCTAGGVCGIVEGSSNAIESVYSFVSNNLDIDITGYAFDDNSCHCRFFRAAICTILDTDSNTVSTKNVYSNGISNNLHNVLKITGDGIVRSDASVNTTTGHYYVTPEENRNIVSEEDFNELYLNSNYFFFLSAISGTDCHVRHIFYNDRSEFLNVALDSSGKEIETSYYDGEFFTPKGIALTLYLNKNVKSAVKVFKINVKSSDVDMINSPLLKYENNNENNLNIYNAKISLYENDDSLQLTSSKQLTINETKIDHIVVPQDQKNIDIQSILLESWINNFTIDSIPLYAVLTNGEYIHLTSSNVDNYLKNYNCTIAKNDYGLGENLATVTLNNANQKFSTTFVLNVIETEFTAIRCVVDQDKVQTQYNVGEEFNPTGLVVELDYYANPNDDEPTTYVLEDDELSTLEFTGSQITEGDNKVIVTANDYNLKAEILVNGIKNPFTFDVTEENLNLLPNGSAQLGYSFTNTSGDEEITWESSDPTIASVSSVGVVTANSIGSVVITATCKGITDSCVVVVDNPATPICIKVTDYGKISYSLNEQFSLSNYEFAVLYSDGTESPINKDNLSYTIPNTTVKGQTSVTITYSGLSITIPIFVGESSSNTSVYIGSNGNWYINGQDSGVKAEGTNGYTPYIGTNGNWYINGVDTGIKAAGSDGADGTNGYTPYIGTNGNWYINGVDTGIKATGSDGTNGTNGYTPYVGTNGNWWINNQDTGVLASGSNGTNGYTPYIGSNSNWWINGEDTGIKAAGSDGADGTNGYTPYIGTNGNWFINGVDTEMKAVGTNGYTPYIGTNGNWWINSTDTGVVAKGTNGDTPYIGSNGNWYIKNEDTGMKASGADGVNGYTPYIGTNGNWYINGVDTGIVAQGSKGDKGDAGADGKDGATPYIGSNFNWWINGVDTGVTAKGSNGDTPYVGANGNWWINNQDTGVLARGSNGTNGYTPYIGTNGNWWINNTDTGVLATGSNGYTPYVGANGNWWINNQDTGVAAEGVSGTTPYVGANGNWWVNNHDTGIVATGSSGTNGYTPYIGSNGNWWVNNQDTGIVAQGQDGKDGKNGCNGSIIASSSIISILSLAGCLLVKRKKND